MENDKLTISCFADVPYEPPKYLGEPYFPIGKLTLVQGDPGCGKTAYICKVAALTSTGGRMLNCEIAQGNVLILSVEDDASTLRGRIEASGGDISKCYFVEEAYAMTFTHEGLQDAIRQTQAKLVVFDPIQSFFGADINTNLSNQTRPILAYLAQVAKEESCAIVLLAHMAKAKEGKSNVLRALGSVDIPGAARSVLQIGRNPSDKNQCVVCHVKSSNAKMGDSFTYITDLQIKGKNEFNGKPLAHKTILKHYIVLHAFFENAVENKVISVSPMQNMKRPKPRKDESKKEAVVYTESEVQYILECLNKEPLKWKALIMFAIDSGCRRGEIVGLRWEEIDFKTGKVNICRNAQYTAGKGTYISTPKNRKNRVIYLNRPVLMVLAEWKRQQTLLHFGQGIPLNGYCFTQDNGEMMNPQAPTSYLSRFGKKYNLPGIHPHALRHTMATLSIVNGADVVSVSKKLGHSNTSITLDVYSHANEEAQQRANDILAEAIYSQKQA